jgi:hypothetical protein
LLLKASEEEKVLLNQDIRNEIDTFMFEVGAAFRFTLILNTQYFMEPEFLNESSTLHTGTRHNYFVNELVPVCHGFKSRHPGKNY